jgi:hypothetical protein
VVQEGHAHYVGNSPAHASSDHWFMDYLVSGHADVTTTLRIPDPLPMGQQARLQVDLASLTAATADRQDNRVAIELNGQSVGEAIWGGARYEQASFNVEASRLQPGDNTLRLRLVGSTNAIVYLDRVTVTYDAPWSADQTLPAAVVTGGAFQATVPAATSQTTVYRVGTTGEPAVGTGTSLAGGVLTFGADAGAGSAYAIVTADDPALTIVPRPTATIDLREPGRQAENLIIAPTALLAEAERLAAYRTSQGLKSLAIPVESIYEAFAGGHREPTAIRDFLRWAVHNWQDPKPSYVLLFGDGHYDPLNWANQASPAPNPLPPLMTDTSMVGEVPNDTALASLDGDKGLPSFFIGRLPVNTLAEARLAVDKVIAYEGAEGAWLKEAIGAFDDNDARFEQTLDRVIGQMGDRTWSRFGITQALALKDRLQQGAGLTLYVGHGSDWGWADEDIFNGDDLAAFAPNGRTGLLVAANCLNGYFSSPWYAGLGEALIVQDRAGSVAFLGTSGFTLPANQERMMSDLFRHLSAGRDLGMASTLAKLNLFLRGDPLWHDELSGWVLLGDPATKLHL